MGTDRAQVLPAPRVRAAGHRRLGVTAWRLIALGMILGAWHVASIPAGALLLPSPLAVAPQFVALLRSGELLAATASSLTVLFSGYSLAILTGVSLGVLMGGIRPFGETLEIFVHAMNSTPRVAFIPLIVLWFGLGIKAKVVIVWLTAVFPILINTYVGVQ
ncbi:MAG: ABC transporter permease, partial [Armatimonadota bacterium]|nr:ABC transporter permease [Armatimonadota bacterium]